jgi:hypothetical protein
MSNDDHQNDQPTEPTPRTPRKAMRRVPRGAFLDTIEMAAQRLHLDANALRARCRRASRRVGDEVIAHLGGGIVAFKFGRSWRVQFPEP